MCGVTCHVLPVGRGYSIWAAEVEADPRLAEVCKVNKVQKNPWRSFARWN